MTKIGKILSQIYFHQLYERDKIFNRLQLHFAIYASTIVFLAYMVRMADYSISCVALTLFYVGIAISLLLLIASIYLTITAWSGYDYRMLPKASELVRYSRELEGYVDNSRKYTEEDKQLVYVDDADTLLDKYLDEALSTCIDENYNINENRRKKIKSSIWYMCLAALPILFSTTLFVLFDLDASSPRKVAPHSQMSSH